MNAWICPTITAVTRKEYERQFNIISKFAARIHFDVSDGSLAPRRLFPFSQMRWHKDTLADVHIMSRYPHADIVLAYHLRPHLVIIHAEAEVDLIRAANSIHSAGIKAGLALLSDTQVEQVSAIIPHFDHALIFSGNLGYQGGSVADLNLLNKVHKLKSLNPNIEIGWDGGINNDNIELIVASGISVANVGGYIQSSSSPKRAYAKLVSTLKKSKHHAE